MAELLRILRRQRSALVSVAAFSAVLNILMLVPAVYMLQVYDRVLSTANLTTLVMLSLMALGLYALFALLDWVRSMLLIRISDQVDEELGQRVYAASLSHQVEAGSGSEAEGIGELAQLRQFMTGSGLLAFFDAPWFPLYLLIIYLFHPLLGVIATLGAAVILALAVFNQYLTRQPQQQAGAYAAKARQLAQDHQRQAEAAEAMGMNAALHTQWRQQQSRAIAWQAHAAEKSALVNACSKGVRFTLQSLMLGGGAYLAVSNQISPGMMIASSLLIGRMLVPLEQVLGACRQWLSLRQSLRQSLVRIAALLHYYPEPAERFSLPPPSGQLSVENISLVPPGSKRPALMHVSFSLEAGDILGVVGASGSGKSSLARLLTGIWSPNLGKVRLDGAEFQQWDRQELGKHIGYLPQDISLFQGSISDNIARFSTPGDDASGLCSGVSPERDRHQQQVIEAAQNAGLHERILALPEGYNTQLGPNGAGLSGGQRQLLGLARALYGKPALLVLDEPNANLDEQGERALAKALEGLRAAQQTVVLISHRMAILQHSTKILALKDGKVQNFGPTAEILQALRSVLANKSSHQDAQQSVSQSTPHSTPHGTPHKTMAKASKVAAAQESPSAVTAAKASAANKASTSYSFSYTAPAIQRGKG